MNSIRVSRAHFPVTALGPGERLAIWTQGCDLGCAGCLARDTWSDDGGTAFAVADVVSVWARARSAGATGLTISGGEPTRQATAVAEIISAVRSTDPDCDVLLYTGLDEDELEREVPQLVAAPDVIIHGRFEITRPTDLVWRGSANQVMRLVTPLGRERFGPYLTAEVSEPPMQFTVEADRIWTIGVPRIGDLPKLAKQARAHGLELGGVSWRP